MINQSGKIAFEEVNVAAITHTTGCFVLFFFNFLYRSVYMELDCSYKPPVKNKKSGWVVQIELLCDCKTTHTKFHNL